MTLLVADVRAAVATLTRLPVGAVVDGRAGAAAFPLVGLGIGLVAAVPVVLLDATEPFLLLADVDALPKPVMGLIAVAMTVALTLASYHLLEKPFLKPRGYVLRPRSVAPAPCSPLRV